MPHRRLPRTRPALWLASAALAAMLSGAAVGADRGFPFDRDLLLDVKPMKGSRRVPVIEVAADGRAAIDLWCNSVEARISVVEATITVTAGRMTDRQCDPARMRGDEELLEALTQVTSWSREGAVVTLRGGRTLRFYQASN
jgi:heat shock protein HslJ